jgi:uncharacterized protein (TIGR03083 family)
VEISARVDTLEQLYASLGGLCAELRAAEWELPTGCPGWTVKDNLAHVAGLDSELCGEPVPAVDLPDLERLKDPLKRHMELAVEARRAIPPPELLDEFRGVSRRYVAELRGLLASGDPDPTTRGPMGFSGPMSRAVPIRIFDVWSHEQDIRRATGRNGNLAGEAVEVSLDRMTQRLSTTLGEAGIPPGTRVAIELTAPAPRRFELVVGEPLEGDGGEPAATLRLDLLDFIARVCGRRDGHGEYLGTVEVSGDPEVGARLVEHLAITP